MSRLVDKAREIVSTYTPLGLAAIAGALVLAATSGVLAATALGVGSQTPTRTVTITLTNGATGPPGPQGPPGPAGASACPDGYSAGKLVINAPGGQVAIWTCLED